MGCINGSADELGRFFGTTPRCGSTGRTIRNAGYKPVRLCYSAAIAAVCACVAQAHRRQQLGGLHIVAHTVGDEVVA